MASRSDVAGAGRSRARESHAVSGELRLGHPAVLLAVTGCALVTLGLVMILSASSVSSFERYGSSFLYFKKQLVWVGLGVAAFLIFARLDYRRLKGAGYVSYVAAAVLLTAVLTPGLGVMVGGSSRWLAFGPVSFQPSEFAKLALVLFAADVFARKHERALSSMSHSLLPLVPALGIFIGLVMMQPDLGTTMILGLIGLGLMFIAGSPLRYFAPVSVAGAAGAAYAALAADYRRARVLAFMDPWADPLQTGYHTIQSLIAMGSGGWFGVGLGASRQKWMYIPNAHTDFIFAILGEEMGFLGTAMVVGLFAFLAYLGVRIARKAPDRFGMLIAAGVTMWIALQAVINMGAVTASLPVTGVPLPLVSFGGSSLLITLSALGILTNIAIQGERKDARRRPRRARSDGDSRTENPG